MSHKTLTKVEASKQIKKTASFILSIQREDGGIPWFKNGKLDPWDHSEALMALSVAGNHKAFKQGMQWLSTNQNANGSWFAQYYGDTEHLDCDKIDSNFVAYPATALWHNYLCTRNKTTLEQFFPTIKSAIEYILIQQNIEGDIQWARSEKESLPLDALLTGNSSILRSLEAAICCAEILGFGTKHWERAHAQLANCIKNKPWRFDRTWESKARFSMDWFYPILSGSYSKEEAKVRLEQSWQKFVVDELGCKCVEDEPWVTVAESCELVMALIASGRHSDALKMFSQLLQWQDNDGGFWTGFQYRDKCIWPNEKTAWTAAAAVLAMDALFGFSPANRIFTSINSLTSN